MINRKQSLLLGVVVALAATALPAGAANWTIVNGSACNPNTNDMTYTRQTVRNNNTSSRSVYCAVPETESTADATSYEFLGAHLKNYGAVAQEVSCIWEAGQPYSGGYESVVAKTTVNPGGAPAATYASLNRPDSFASLGVYCGLKPGTAVDILEVHRVITAP